MNPLPSVLFSKNTFVEIGRYLQKNNLRGALFTDGHLQKIFQKELSALKQTAPLEIFAFEATERTKALSTVEKLANLLQERGFGRKNTVILALGGGVLGDIVGFLASIYLRGVPYLQIPTTLLAMVDSGIGGKTGVNSKYGKNMLGSFYHPETVLIDVSFLRQLPEKEIRNGLAEMVKHSILDSREHLDDLEKSIPAILNRDEKVLALMIKKSIQVKLAHVKPDEKERKGIRSFLNFGHTIGHAVEKASNYKIPHGQAVAIGMVLESEIAEKELGFSGKNEIVRVLKKCGLPTVLPKAIDKKKLKQFMKQDKKNEDGKVTYVLPQTFGHFLKHQ